MAEASPRRRPARSEARPVARLAFVGSALRNPRCRLTLDRLLRLGSHRRLRLAPLLALGLLTRTDLLASGALLLALALLALAPDLALLLGALLL